MSEGPIHILSLGAGVQSSALALMAAAGEIGPMPTCAIFADTQAEPASVYRWLDWLETQLPFPVHRVTKGDLGAASLAVRTSRTSGKKYTKHAVPAFIVNAAGQKGILMRQCTLDFKITVIHRKIREVRKEHGGALVKQWIGISRDEAHRMKPSRINGIENMFPLVDRGLTRVNCSEFISARFNRTAPRSSCRFCPYHSNEEWLRLKNDEPADFEGAVKYDEDLRAAIGGKVIAGIPYLHASRVPLRDVDFRSGDERAGQGNLFAEECDGICGV